MKYCALLNFFKGYFACLIVIVYFSSFLLSLITYFCGFFLTLAQALQNLGLCHILSVYLKGLDDENKEWCAELQELHYQAAWRNMQWDHCISVK